MEKKLKEMLNLFLANVENIFQKLVKLFTYFDVDQSNHMGGDQYRSARDSWEIK